MAAFALSYQSVARSVLPNQSAPNWLLSHRVEEDPTTSSAIPDIHHVIGMETTTTTTTDVATEQPSEEPPEFPQWGDEQDSEQRNSALSGLQVVDARGGGSAHVVSGHIVDIVKVPEAPKEKPKQVT